VKRSFIKSLLIMIVLVFGHTTTAQGFSVGAGLDSPGLLEVRVVYETNDFGVRAYLTYFGLWGTDIYARLARTSNITLRFGVGVVVFKDFQEVGIRGLIAIASIVAPNTVFALEFRPMYFPSVWSETPTSDPVYLLTVFSKAFGRLFTLFSITFSLEYHF
jgi:hypothetical protein